MKLTITQKLVVGFGVCVLVIGGLAIFNVYRLNQLAELQHEGAKLASEAVLAAEAGGIGPQLYLVVAETIINRNFGEAAEQWKEMKKEARGDLARLRKMTHTDEERRHVDEAEESLNEIIRIYENKILPAVQASQGVEANVRSADAELDRHIIKLRQSSLAIMKFADQDQKEADEKFDGIIEGVRSLSVYLSIAAVIFIVFFTILIAVMIRRQLRRLTAGIDGVSADIEQGDLSSRVKDEDAGVDFKTIPPAVNKLVATMTEIVESVAESVEQISRGARQIAETSQTLSQGATEQASSIEEVTSAVTELASQSRQSMEVSERGNTMMSDMMTAMNELNQASENVSRIIKSIDEIAFQTNLLALNAAVEAARAGKFGKGFAVVAEEVKNLSNRSAQAARETAEIIEASVSKARGGAAIAQDTSGAMKEITIAATEQVKGIGQIEQSIQQIDQVTQSNAANAEENAAASEELNGQATHLGKMVARFRSGENGRSLKVAGGRKTIAAPPTAQKAENSPVSGNGLRQREMAALHPAAARPEEVVSLQEGDFSRF